MESQSLPEFLRPLFWSVDFVRLDKIGDRFFIINQILSLGDLPALRWLFANYSSGEIRQAFVEHPAKVYRPASFHFAKEVLLEVREPLVAEKYVINSPRLTR